MYVRGRGVSPWGSMLGEHIAFVRRDCGAGLRGVLVSAVRRKWAGVGDWFGPRHVEDASLRS